MSKFCQLSPELWPLIDVILCSNIELIFRGGVSCLPAALLLYLQVMMTCMRAQKSSNFGLIGPRTAELAALERQKKIPIGL